jgi:transposase
VHKIREVLRLKFDCGPSHRAAARSCAISHSTVVENVHRAQAAHLGCSLPDGLSDEELFRRLYPQPPRPTTRSIPEPDWLSIRAELARKGVTPRLLWVEYREQRPDGYAYSKLCELYRRF